uniref:Uncharacterized protein n=1 Tax=Caenorhabditis japonica TaxID=281687 RepID=A0A8R1IIK5_CAEJA
MSCLQTQVSLSSLSLSFAQFLISVKVTHPKGTIIVGYAQFVICAMRTDIDEENDDANSVQSSRRYTFQIAHIHNFDR